MGHCVLNINLVSSKVCDHQMGLKTQAVAVLENKFDDFGYISGTWSPLLLSGRALVCMSES